MLPTKLHKPIMNTRKSAMQFGIDGGWRMVVL